MPATHTIYERNADESEKAWKAFSIFLDLGSERGLSVVAAKLSVSRQAIQKIAKKHNWVERATAYDNCLQSALTEATIEETIDIMKEFYEVTKLELKAQKNELIIKINEQNRKIANPDYEYRPASIRTISESGKMTVEKHLSLVPQDNKADDTGDLFKLIKDCRVIDASTSE